MRKPKIDMSLIDSRRKQLSKVMGGGVLVLSAKAEFIRNGDVFHSYRQDSDFYYLTGFEEPRSIFVFRPGMNPETILFVQPKDKLLETWTGFQFGVDGAKAHFSVDQAYRIDQFEELAPQLLLESDKVFYSMYLDANMDQKMETVLKDVKSLQGRSGKGLFTIKDPRPLIGEMRLIKSDYEIEILSKAVDISAQAHLAVMKKIRPGINERALHGYFISEIMAQGADREGYGSIMAGGNNATTLHYVFNDCECLDGDLFLVDAGAEYRYYTGDITRTYPVNGRFTEVQKRLYERVLDVQKQIIAMVRPGCLFENLEKKTVELLTDLMRDEKILSGSRQEIIEKKSYKKYYPHGVSHWLGSDVHDSGLYNIDAKSRALEERMCLTLEPGIYIPEDDKEAPEELRGIGIRIEDDLLVTQEGCRVLSEKAIKEVADIEAIVGST